MNEKGLYVILYNIFSGMNEKVRYSILTGDIIVFVAGIILWMRFASITLVWIAALWILMVCALGIFIIVGSTLMPGDL